MNETKQAEGYQGQFSSTDTLKKRTIDWIFEAGRMGCRKQESIADYTYETDFINAVKYAKSQVWKYTPPKIKLVITTLYQELDKELDTIDNNKEINDRNKTLSKQKKAYETSSQVLEILFHVIQESPLSVEYANMEVKDFETLIKTIRSPEALKLFSGDADDPE